MKTANKRSLLKALLTFGLAAHAETGRGAVISTILDPSGAAIRNNDGILGDRPDIANPRTPLNTTAIIFPQCATGYENPDSGVCVSPDDVQAPQMSVNGTPAGRFMNRDFTDSGIRTMWVQAKVVF